MKRYSILAASLSLTIGAFLAAAPAAAVTCNLPSTVGGGTLGVSPGAGLGWSVGSGQCNGDFTVVEDATFPGGKLELGMRAEERRVGQVPNNSGNYLVQTGLDVKLPVPSSPRAWWNFQHSIAYQGDIESLDSLTFTIRTDEGPSVPAGPANMLALRPTIDDRTGKPNPTVTYAEVYQTSQNPFFGWFSSYDATLPGAWYLTLTATKAGQTASVSICIHTPGLECAKEVQVDLRPGSTNDSINTNAKQLVPIAIMGNAGFDPATEVDMSSILVRGAKVRSFHEADTDGDGFTDLVMQFRAREMSKPTAAECDDPDAEILLTGVLFSSRSIRGTDSVTWLGPDCP